jgi:hypothetical protein
MFASKTIAGHLTRGVIAATLIAWALAHQSSEPAFAAIAGLGSLVAMRGCPLCWTLGLFETIGESIRARRISRRLRTPCSSNVCHRNEDCHELLHA